MHTEILILGQLLAGPKHGYEIKKDIQEALGDQYVINNNLLYPALRRFLEEGYIHKEIVHAEGKPDRNVYSLTDAGVEQFNQLIGSFSEKMASNEHEFFVRVALFDRLDKQRRLEILEMRREVLIRRADYYQKIESTRHGFPMAMEVVRFQKTRLEYELAWIEMLKANMRREGE